MHLTKILGISGGKKKILKRISVPQVISWGIWIYNTNEIFQENPTTLDRVPTQVIANFSHFLMLR